MQIKKIQSINTLSSPKKSVGTIRRGWGVLYPFLRNQERNTKISRTPPRLRAYKWDKHLRAQDYQEIEQEEKKGGVENLQLVEDHNINLYRVRYSKHD